MKRLFLSISLLFGSLLAAQEIYLHPSIGYGIGFPGEPASTFTETEEGAKTNLELIGYGGGLNAAASFGLITDNNWGFDLNFHYQNFLGKVTTDRYGSGVERSVKYTSWSVRFTPSIRIEADGDEINPFIMFGPTLNYIRLRREHKDHILNSGDELLIVTEITGRLSYGASLSAGVEFELGRDIYLTTAIQALLGYFKPKESMVTKAEISGEDVLSDLPTNQREAEYVNEINFSELNDPDKKNKILAEPINYSSVALMLGVRFVLN